MSGINKIMFSGIFLFKDGHILLMKRTGGEKFNGFWGVPGGHVNVGETFSQASIREIREEIGIYISQEDIVSNVFVHGLDSNTEFLGYYGFCTNWGGNPINNEPNKCSRLAWFKTDAFPKDITPLAKIAFQTREEGKTLTNTTNLF